MAEMGKYCKAYLASRFREFPGWQEEVSNLRPNDAEKPGQTPPPRTELLDEDVLFLQENYVVTDGIAKDEFVIFDAVDEAWTQFCHEQLGFEIPQWDPIEIEVRAPEEAGTDEDGSDAPAN